MSTRAPARPPIDDPTVGYDSPAHLARDTDRPPEERLRLLRRWQAHVLQEERAANEGMPGRASVPVRAVAEAVETVKRQLEVESHWEGDPAAAAERAMDAVEIHRPVGPRIPVLAALVFTVAVCILLVVGAPPGAFAALGLGILALPLLWIAVRRTRGSP